MAYHRFSLTVDIPEGGPSPETFIEILRAGITNHLVRHVPRSTTWRTAMSIQYRPDVFPEGKTVEARIPVAVTCDGQWNVCADSKQSPEDNYADTADFFQGYNAHVVHVLVDLPLPAEKEVRGQIRMSAA